MKIPINVIETLSRKVIVEAGSIDDAIVIVQQMYRDEEIVLDYNDFHGKLMIEKQEGSFDNRKDFLINELINYLIEDERKHYEEVEQPSEHIYLTLLELKKSI